LTVFTTTGYGTAFFISTRTDLLVDLGLNHLTDYLLSLVTFPLEVWTTPELLATGLSFSIPLLVILLSHELGHFFACRRHQVVCTLPYFLPAPFLIGTFGAFIRIRGRIRSSGELLDIGAAGPVFGFLALLPLLVYGFAHSSYSAIVEIDWRLGGDLLYLPGRSAISWLLMRLFHGPLEPGLVIDLHPTALASWVGLLVTALNLIPAGQLDGGHILYAVSPHWYRRVRPVVIVALAVLGWWWRGWWLWLGIVLVLARRHPPLLRPAAPLNPRRRRLALLTLIIFLLVFVPVPLSIITVLS
jgi:membrane-associated protease RseP (regulator of RpoE activity)